MAVTWKAFEAAAPELAGLGRERFQRTRVALVATLRADGSPRISPVEPHFVSGQLLLGMERTRKSDDLLRDPRCAVHSSVSDPDGADGEFKLYGRAVVVEEPAVTHAHPDAWWTTRPPGTYHVFAFHIESAAFIGWDIENDQMTLIRWSLKRGLTRATRSRS